jgi:hypothetical protein
MFRKKQLRIEWKSQPTLNFIANSNDIQQLREIILNKKEIMATILRVHIQKIIRLTNTEARYLHRDNQIKKSHKIIPYCYLYGIYNILSCIAHLGDGTCTGRTWEGMQENYL